MDKARYRVGPTKVTSYRSDLKDKYRPPSKGGNTRAYHRHAFQIGDNWYSFLALGAKRWVYANDTVEFEWSWDDSGKFRNVHPDTITTTDKDGKTVVRGERGSKRWRSAPAKMPVSKREQRD